MLPRAAAVDLHVSNGILLQESPGLFSLRETQRDSPINRWSRTETSSCITASNIARVTLMFSELSEDSLLWLLCSSRIAAAFCCSADLESSPARTMDKFSELLSSSTTSSAPGNAD